MSRISGVTENDLASIVVDSAIKVHWALGPGLLESVVETALSYEIAKLGVDVKLFGKEGHRNLARGALVDRRIVIRQFSARSGDAQLALNHSAAVTGIGDNPFARYANPHATA